MTTAKSRTDVEQMKPFKTFHPFVYHWKDAEEGEVNATGINLIKAALHLRWQRWEAGVSSSGWLVSLLCWTPCRHHSIHPLLIKNDLFTLICYCVDTVTS